MSTELRDRIGHCRHLLEQREQATRNEAWHALPQLQQAYAEAFEGLRAMLGEGPLADAGLREQLAELERRQRRLVYEFRKGQMVIKARLDDLQDVRQRLARLGPDDVRSVSASVDRSI